MGYKLFPKYFQGYFICVPNFSLISRSVQKKNYLSKYIFVISIFKVKQKIDFPVQEFPNEL